MPRTTPVGSALRRWRSAGQRYPESSIRVESLMFQDLFRSTYASSHTWYRYTIMPAITTVM